MIYASLDYASIDRVRKDPDLHARLIPLWPGLRAEDKPEHFFGSERQRISLEEAAAIEALGLKLKYEGVDGTMITRMQDRRDWRGQDVQIRDVLSGTAVNITIPDLMLARVDEVTHLDDACTDELQRHLDDGWRILAVCPPNAARRPDYILGRTRTKS